MNNKKYLVIPGYIDSKTDNDVHYMDAYRLIELYGVDHKECMIFERSLLKTINRDDFIVLNPLYDENYEEVLKERLAAYESRE